MNIRKMCNSDDFRLGTPSVQNRTSYFSQKVVYHNTSIVAFVSSGADTCDLTALRTRSMRIKTPTSSPGK